LPSPASSPTCLLVIPAYQDTLRLEPYLARLTATLPPAFTVQVVDDGSGAQSTIALQQVMARVREQTPPAGSGPVILPPLLLPVNQGKGAAVRAGWQNCAAYDLAGFADADGAVSASEVLRAYHYFCDHLDAVDGLLGCRVKMLGRRVERHLSRHLIGRIYATVVSNTCRLEVYDSQCGLKLFRSARLTAALPRLTINRFAFDVELILQLLQDGARLEEFPVDWTDQPGGKLKVWRDFLPMLLDVCRIGQKFRKT